MGHENIFDCNIIKKWVKMFQSMASAIIKKPGGSIRTACTPENTVSVQAIISGNPR